MYDGILLTRPRQNLQNIEQRSIKNNHIELFSCKYQISNVKCKKKILLQNTTIFRK